MGSSTPLPLRALPRVFLQGFDSSQTQELPKNEFDKFSKVLRLKTGDQVAVLDNLGHIIRCELQGHNVTPLEIHTLDQEPAKKITLILALPKPDPLETILRMGTELGVDHFVLFPSDRSVIKWDPSKLQDRLKRFKSIIQEAAEQCYATKLPQISTLLNLKEVLNHYPNAKVLNEHEQIKSPLKEHPSCTAIIVGPEGGWSPKEMPLVLKNSVTLGKRVLRVDTAAITAAAMIIDSNT